MLKFNLFLITFYFLVGNAQVGINTSDPDQSAIMDVYSTDKGFLPPRLTTGERDGISGPATGLVIYNKTVKCIEVYNGMEWDNLCEGSSEGGSTLVNSNIIASNISYQGQSVIDSQGIGYNGESVPAASTITVELTNTDVTSQSYTLVATDPSTGLEYTASGTLDAGAVNVPVVLSNNSATMPPFESGVVSMPLLGASNVLILEPRIDVKSIPLNHPDWTFNEVNYGGETFLDRNLGARRPATSIDDVFSFGSYYQWGRPGDGHEITVWNGTTKTEGKGFYESTALEDLSTTDTPSHNNFIITNNDPLDWRSNNNNNRWATVRQGPCPTGFHVPTDSEMNSTLNVRSGSGNGLNGSNTSGWDNNVEAFDSNLKLPSAGLRARNTGDVSVAGANGFYWTSNIGTTTTTSSRFLRLRSTSLQTDNNYRAFGFSVRCIKN